MLYYGVFVFSRHVQVNNETAIKFYEGFGFEIVEKKQNYYKRIEPADAFVLQKTFKKGSDEFQETKTEEQDRELEEENKENEN